jgi:predicted RNase H-like nuclease
MPPGRPGDARARIVPRAADLPELGAPVAIDSPIGLMDVPEDGPRPPDTAARAFLRDRNADGLRGVGARVFAAPCRAHLDAFRAEPDYAAFRAAFPPPRSLSKQAWNICGKIAELDDLCRAAPEAPLWESHPEVAFAHRAGRTLPPKKSPAGRAAREAALGAAGFDLTALGAMLPQGRRRWAPDDLLDACMLALTAARIADGRHAGLPGLAGRDGHGLRRAIFY